MVWEQISDAIQVHVGWGDGDKSLHTFINVRGRFYVVLGDLLDVTEGLDRIVNGLNLGLPLFSAIPSLL